MSKEKQIEEMANIIYDNRPHKDVWIEDAEGIASVLYNAGYRKQREGEWKYRVEHRRSVWVSCNIICDQCCYEFERLMGVHFNFCPNCGAKMKGGE